MITLITGQPGHGKTLRAIQLAVQLHSEGREVYACRVRGLDYQKTGFKELASLDEWQSLPDGSVVFVDECYEDIPSRSAASKVPAWEQAMATHRHRGFDFILVCQMGSQISPFVRALIDTHVHVRRKFGLAKSVLLTWDRYCASVASDSEIKSARHVGWKYPKEIYDLYKSAEVHTVKRNLPWQIFAIPILIGVVCFLVWSLFHRFYARDPLHGGATAAQAAEVQGQGAGKGAAAVVKKPMTREEYVKQMVPLVPGMPWSAPVFADRRPRAEPRIYCMLTAVDEEKIEKDFRNAKCGCMSEQATRIVVDRATCLTIVQHGVYNPYLEPVKDGAQQAMINSLDRQYYRIQLDSDRGHTQ